MPGSRFYRALLRCLPEGIRGRFGTDMEEVFLLRLSEARSPVARLGVWARTALDVGAVACREVWPAMRPGPPRGRSGDTGLAQDVRHAARGLRRSPALTTVVVGTLALGISAATVTFSVVDAVLLEPLPYADPDHLVAVWPEQNFNASMLTELLTATPALESITGISGWRFTLIGAGEPLEVDGARVSPDHFRVLGVRPVLGRDFADDEGLAGNDAVVILSHGLWVRAFDADPNVIGRSIELATNYMPRRTVIGVLPPDFRPVYGRPDVWVPLGAPPATSLESDSTWYVTNRVARLARGATLEQASEQVRGFARAVQARLDQTIRAATVEVAGVRPLRSELAGDLGPVMWVALGAVSLVLLIVCANVANLLLARGEARRADLTVRVALGAGRRRITRLLLAESALLGAAGGGLGIALSYALLRGVLRLAPADFPRLGEAAIDGGVLTYAIATTAAATLLAGLVPALRVSRASVAASIGAAGRSPSGRSGSRLSAILVGAQVALAMVVVIGSGLMLRSLHSMTSEDPGLDGRGVLAFRPSPPEGRYPSGLAFHAYYDAVLERVRALPAVERASAIHLLPGTRDNWSFPTFIEGVDVVPGEVIPTINFRVVWPDYFETVGTAVLQGRGIERSDDLEAAPVVVVNRAFAERFWPSDDPLGREVRLFATEAAPYRVVGVVEDVRQHGLGQEARPELYFAHAQVPWNMAFWVVARMRAGRPRLEQVADLRAAVWSVDPDVPIRSIEELSRVMSGSAATTRFLTVVLGAFGAFALLLSAVGVFCVTAYGVGRRIPEFGVRIALGASRAELVGSALAGMVLAVAIGLGAGALAASLSSDALTAALYEVEPQDPTTFAAAAGVLLLAATAAALVPAWRAARVDPVTALRGD